MMLLSRASQKVAVKHIASTTMLLAEHVQRDQPINVLCATPRERAYCDGEKCREIRSLRHLQARAA